VVPNRATDSVKEDIEGGGLFGRQSAHKKPLTLAQGEPSSCLRERERPPCRCSFGFILENELKIGQIKHIQYVVGLALTQYI
jgi:hypothetical protein